MMLTEPSSGERTRAACPGSRPREAATSVLPAFSFRRGAEECTRGRVRSSVQT
jgi:hypothetical protein